MHMGRRCRFLLTTKVLGMCGAILVRSDLRKGFGSGGAVIWVTFQKVCAAFGVFKVVSS